VTASRPSGRTEPIKEKAMNAVVTQHVQYVHATEKQVSFLNRLLDEATDMLLQRDGLTGRSEAQDIIENHVIPMRPGTSTLKEKASRDIDAAMDNNRKLRTELADLRASQPEAAPAGFVETGMYNLNGRIFKVLPSRNSDRHYAQELVGEQATGYQFKYARGAMYRLRPEHRMTPEQAAEFGKLTGSCCCCGRLLTNPKSVALGIGPDCRKTYF
jgi:hypothetical protein